MNPPKAAEKTEPEKEAVAAEDAKPKSSGTPTAPKPAEDKKETASGSPEGTVKLVPTDMNPPKSTGSPEPKKADESGEIKIAPVSKSGDKSDGKKGEENASDPYKPIILAPSDSDSAKKDDVNITLVAKNPAKTAEYKKSASEEPKKLEDLTVKPNELESGKYYVQIATLSSAEKAQEIIDKYGSRYPLLFVPGGRGGTHQVLVGPLNVDEYGSILEKFRAYGYKDAYPRKIK